MANIITKLEDFLALKPKGHYRVSSRDGKTILTISRPGEDPEAYYCASPGVANQLRQHLTDQGMVGYIEDDPTAPQGDTDAFRHGRSAGGSPKTWTGRIVTMDEWHKLTEWDRHGPNGKLFCGVCRAWVVNFPNCHEGGEGRV